MPVDRDGAEHLGRGRVENENDQARRWREQRAGLLTAHRLTCGARKISTHGADAGDVADQEVLDEQEPDDEANERRNLASNS